MTRCLLALLLGLSLAPPGAAAQSPPSESAVRGFLKNHWTLPVPLQGSPPARWNSLEASLLPESCGTCHPAQLDDWKTSLHAKSLGPGVKGQLVEMLQSDPQSAQDCLRCHAPLAEQQEQLVRKGKLRGNAAFNQELQTKGLSCAGCHVRRHQRFGPPKRDGSLRSEIPREKLPHNGVTRTPAFLRSEFCKECHQFPEGGFALNGKLLENTYNEWKTSPFGRQGIQCQECHMPDRRHLWRGIHDPEMVRSGLTIGVEGDKARYRQGEVVRIRLTVTNSRVGHAFPTYVTPRVVVSGELIERSGLVVPGSRQETIIGREVTLDLSREEFDSRLHPGQRLVFDYRRPLPGPGLRLRLAVTVSPDHFYIGFFESLLAGGAGTGAVQIREALARAKASAFDVYAREIPLD